jgi:SAM-dependent methyltransferase
MSDGHGHTQGHGHAHGHGHEDGDVHRHGHGDEDALADLLDLDAVVLAGQLACVYADLERLAAAPVRRILDVGAGTGTGTFGLLAHFADARVVAVDASESMQRRILDRAASLGLGDRVETLLADLDQRLPELEPVDLAWASASLHHLADPDRTLAQIVATLRPGGLLAVLEMAGPPRFLADDTPGGRAEARVHALLAADRAVDLPTMGSDWGPRLERAGLTVEVERTLTVESPPATSRLGDYAAATLARVRSAVADRLAPAEVADLDALLAGGPDDVRRRDDLRLDTERRLWIARRAGGRGR